MNDNGELFRPAFIPLFLGTFLAGTLCCALITLILEALGYQLPGVFSFSFLRVLAIVYLWAMFSAATVAWMLSVRIDANGLQGRTFWGNNSQMNWQDIEQVRRTVVPGIRFIRLFSRNGGAPMWVPLFLRDRETFLRRLHTYAGESHPINLTLSQ